MSDERRLVAIHGWVMCPDCFEPLRARLPGWEVHAPPLPGHAGAEDGVIDPEALAEHWADELQAPAIWCGWSLGGHVALAAARRWPERVRALILAGVSPRFDQAPDWPFGRPPRELRAMRHSARHDAEAVVAGLYRLLSRGREAAWFRERDVRTPAPAGLDSGLARLQRADLRPDLPAIVVPAVWACGDLDALVPIAAARAGAQAMPRARCEVFQGAGHAPFLADPARFAAVIKQLHEETR